MWVSEWVREMWQKKLTYRGLRDKCFSSLIFIPSTVFKAFMMLDGRRRSVSRRKVCGQTAMNIDATESMKQEEVEKKPE